MTAALLGLTQACSYTEQYWVNNATCSGEPISEVYNIEELNKCYADERKEGRYAMITECSGGTFTSAIHGQGDFIRGEDPDCITNPGVFSYKSGVC